jgi:hypothetical protein
VHWIAAALRASNSTVGNPAPVDALLPRYVPTAHWADFKAGDLYFSEAASLASVGAATPSPGSYVNFNPHRPVSGADFRAWIAAARRLHQVAHVAVDRDIATASRGRSSSVVVKRFEAATLLLELMA